MGFVEGVMGGGVESPTRFFDFFNFLDVHKVEKVPPTCGELPSRGATTILEGAFSEREGWG